MSVRLSIDPDSLAGSGRTLAAVAQRMADDLALLETTVHRPALPGDSLFGVAYQAVLGHALQTLGTYVQEMGEAAITLTETARAVVANDTLDPS
ncbi:hypothetical protein [Actinoplanes sp. G11-F43]|uniref:hypothetical protein n=1 Tax=Actinoplanes sp. G11-F43 TaxID=3424130 RepID=UPI003D348690